MTKTFATEGIVLKRINVGEADRVVTQFTRGFGKLACVAKGVRKLSSSKKSALEPGMYSKIFCAESRGMPILTQAQVIEDYPNTRDTLHATRNLVQILEILDAMTVEENGQEVVFEQVLAILRSMNAHTSTRSKIAEMLRKLLAELGFHEVDDRFKNVTEFVEHLSERKMKSFGFLTVKEKS